MPSERAVRRGTRHSGEVRLSRRDRIIREGRGGQQRHRLSTTSASSGCWLLPIPASSEPKLPEKHRIFGADKVSLDFL
jgi:hypothetical protein